MVERVFTGWDRPFLGLLVDWLLARRDELPGMLVVVPTAQAGRRLRETLAESAGALLAPKVVTPGHFLRVEEEGVAADWIEQVAWVEVLEGIRDWSLYVALFPEAPGEGRDWAGGLAAEMQRLRRALQENGLMLRSGARAMAATVEAERWAALALLEDAVEQRLKAWGMKSRSRVLAGGLAMPAGISRIVVAGVADVPPLLERAWSGDAVPVTVLIGAPESEAEGFSNVGRPTVAWAERPVSWPEIGSVRVTADPRQQAAEALRVVAAEGTVSDGVVLGSADTETGDELARVFSRHGWRAFHPAAAAVTAGLPRWFGVWREWLGDPTLAVMADLLALPESGVLVGGKRAQKALRLAKARDKWMVARTEDLRRWIGTARFRSERDKASAEELLKAAESLESWRDRFLRDDFPAALERLLGALARTGPATEEESQRLSDWLAGAADLTTKVERGARFWIERMLSAVPAPAPLPPEGRVIDVQGWLELFHEPGQHLVLCGMNEGKVPARGGGEPWLSEASRERLGLIKDADRAARDAFLFRAMLEARRTGGRVDVICGKSGAGGESLLPSRLLLAGEREDLPRRVAILFQEVEPPEAGLRWQADWLWTPRQFEPPKRISVTSLRDYLACPFRYYLKHVAGMQGTDTGRAEWNARDFGTVAHEVLERWGRDEEARAFDKAEAIHGWLSAELDRVVAEWFGARVPLAVRIQTEALRQRFVWLARLQACETAAGWDVIDVERKIEIPAGEALLVAKIDRIDRNRHDGTLRVLDYKTGKVDAVDRSHRKKITASVVMPRHLATDGPAVIWREEKGKPVSYLWQNLQLPLYAAALAEQGVAMPAYFTLPSTEAGVAVHEWAGFESDDLESALDCARWVAGRIAEKVFWPPAEKASYDDYRILAPGGLLEEAVAEPAEWSVIETKPEIFR